MPLAIASRRGLRLSLTLTATRGIAPDRRWAVVGNEPMKRLPIALLTGLAALAVTSAVQARGVNITYTGVTLQGLDETGVLTAADLYGAPFSVVYRADGPVPPGGYAPWAGTLDATSTDRVSAVLTIDHHQYRVSGDAFGLAARGVYFASPDLWEIYSRSDDLQGDSSTASFVTTTLFNVVVAQSGPISHDYGAPLRYSLRPGDGFGGYLDIHRQNYPPSGPAGAYNTHVDFTVQTVTVSSAPEPASWTTLLLGVGGVGAVLRRVRRRTSRPGSNESATPTRI